MLPLALRLPDVGWQAGGRSSVLRAFTGVGSYLTEAGRVIDEIALSR